MPPSVCESTPATPADFAPPTPTGKLGSVLTPTFDLNAPLTAERESVKLYEVPEPSERKIGGIFVDGRDTPLLSAWIDASFQVVTLPRKMFASTGPVSFRWFGRPLPLYATAVAESAHGIWTQPLQAVAWSGVSGASDAPKSTLRPLMALIPAPEPTGL